MVTDLEKRLRLLERDNKYLSELLEQADALITTRNALIDRIRIEFGMLLLVAATAGFVLGICIARAVWSLPS